MENILTIFNKVYMVYMFRMVSKVKMINKETLMVDMVNKIKIFKMGSMFKRVKNLLIFEIYSLVPYLNVLLMIRSVLS